MPSRTGVIVSRAIRRARQVFHCLVGLTFIGLAIAGGSVSLKVWNDYQAASVHDKWGFSMVITMAVFTLLLLFFGLYSFLKARSVR